VTGYRLARRATKCITSRHNGTCTVRKVWGAWNAPICLISPICLSSSTLDAPFPLPPVNSPVEALTLKSGGVRAGAHGQGAHSTHHSQAQGSMRPGKGQKRAEGLNLPQDLAKQHGKENDQPKPQPANPSKAGAQAKAAKYGCNRKTPVSSPNHHPSTPHSVKST
jgi:hypothetical protein